MHGPFQVMNSFTFMEIRVFESSFQLFLYFKVGRTPSYHPGTSVIWNMGQRQKINTMGDSCIDWGQKDGPILTMKKIYASLYDFFIHSCVIKRGIENNWGIWGYASQSSLNNSTTIYITTGGGVQILGIYCICN